MRVQRATLDDFTETYALGLATPELQVSADAPFMEPNEFKWYIENKDCLFLIAREEDKLAGFLVASIKDMERPFPIKYACIVYVTVKPEFRNKGIAKTLCNTAEMKLKQLGAERVYAWANDEGNGAVKQLFRQQGFAEGHRYVWMDKELK